jgi:hypothetical protein
MHRSKNYNVFLKGIFGLALFVSVFGFTPRVHAQAWGLVDIFGDLITNMIEVAQRSMEGAILSGLKSTALTLMNSQVMQLVGGSSAGNSAIISDWRGFLNNEPEKKAQVAGDEFWGSVLRGRDSSSSYHAMLAGQDEGLDNYYSMLKEQAEGFSNDDVNSWQTAPMDMQKLKSGDIQLFSQMFEPANNPYGLALKYQAIKATTYEKARQEKVVEATSSGYASKKDENGFVILPGSTIGDVVANTQDIGNKMVAAAENPGELMTGVISGLTNKFLTNMIQNGVGRVQANIQKEIRAVDSQIGVQVREINKNLGPAAEFTKEFKQQTDPYVKPASNAKTAAPKTCFAPPCL